jgi:hypothetical protein
LKKRSTKQTNVEHQLTDIDIKRIQAVIDGELEAKWVSDDEILAVRDRLYDAIAGKIQTHYGVYTVH